MNYKMLHNDSLVHRAMRAAIAKATCAEGIGKCKYRIGAALIVGYKIVQVRHNTYKTHPTLAKLTKWPHLHAESYCILSHGIENCSGGIMCVARVDKEYNLRMAKPCAVCTGLMLDTGIQVCYYTDNEGEVQELRL